MDETWSDCKYLLENQIIFVKFLDMTPLNPSKRVKTAKKVCREAERAPWVAILTVFINFQGDVLYFHEKENKFLIAWYIIFEFYGSVIKS